jgi:hypothetical protein
MNERRLIEPMLFPLQAHRAPGRRYGSSVVPNDQGSQSAAEPRQVLGPDLNCSESTVQRKLAYGVRSGSKCEELALSICCPLITDVVEKGRDPIAVPLDAAWVD